MALKNARLTRAENLPAEIRRQFGLPETGLVIIESLNPDLRENFVAIKDGGIRSYLLSKGEFQESALEE
jgi:hypothetical protein